MFSLKFCTAIEWPGAHQHVAAMLQQRVHRHDEEAGAARRSRSSGPSPAARSVTKIIAMTIEAHRDADRQHLDRRRAARRSAPRSPRRPRCPTATTPCSIDACDRLKPSAFAAQSITMNCSVAPAPQNSVVVASEIWPSLSRHSSATQCANSRIRNSGLRFTIRWSTPVSGMNQLKTAAIDVEHA